jgi:hypothetical protein
MTCSCYAFIQFIGGSTSELDVAICLASKIVYMPRKQDCIPKQDCFDSAFDKVNAVHAFFESLPFKGMVKNDFFARLSC